MDLGQWQRAGLLGHGGDDGLMDVVSRIPRPLSSRPASAGAATYALSGIQYDFAIGGM